MSRSFRDILSLFLSSRYIGTIKREIKGSTKDGRKRRKGDTYTVEEHPGERERDEVLFSRRVYGGGEQSGWR